MMQFDTQLWSNLMWVSGGLLELEECSYHNLHFKFELNGRHVTSFDAPPFKIQLKHTQTSETVDIPFKPVCDLHKTVGHYKAPAATGATQIQVLKEKAENYAKLESGYHQVIHWSGNG
eukprot:1104547-Ditylum_brightwellii.AAC.1